MKKVGSRLYLGLVFLFLYAPILVMIFFSFNASSSKYKFTGFSLRWYARLFNDSALMEALLNTLIVAFLAAVLATVLGTMAAIGFHNMKKRSRGIAMNISNIPIINPEIVTGVSLMLLFVAVLRPMGLQLGFFTVLLSHIAFNTPYVILNVAPKLRQMDKNLYEAALDLGCSPVQAFRKVVLPEIMPGVTAGALMAFTYSLDDFIISYFTSGTFQTLPVYIYSLLKKPIPLSINALSTLLFLLVLTVLLITNIKDIRQSRREARGLAG